MQQEVRLYQGVARSGSPHIVQFIQSFEDKQYLHIITEVRSWPAHRRAHLAGEVNPRTVPRCRTDTYLMLLDLLSFRNLSPASVHIPTMNSHQPRLAANSGMHWW